MTGEEGMVGNAISQPDFPAEAGTQAYWERALHRRSKPWAPAFVGEAEKGSRSGEEDRGGEGTPSASLPARCARRPPPYLWEPYFPDRTTRATSRGALPESSAILRS
jgi:hypothetical protein